MIVMLSFFSDMNETKSGMKKLKNKSFLSSFRRSSFKDEDSP